MVLLLGYHLACCMCIAASAELSVIWCACDATTRSDVCKSASPFKPDRRQHVKAALMP